MKIGIINYGVGNLKSVYNCVCRINSNTEIVNNPLFLKEFDKIILPGTGSFHNCINLIKKDNWFEEIQEMVINKKKHILGICLGMQLFSKVGSEGNNNILTKGLGFIDSEVKSLKSQGCKLKTPLIGWNELKINKKSLLLKNVKNNSDVYFINSYSLVPKISDVICATTNYDIDFVSSIEKDNIFGTQFHPEKVRSLEDKF